MIANMQQKHARLRMGISDVSGWGLFTSEALEKDDFIYEYMGTHRYASLNRGHNRTAVQR